MAKSKTKAPPADPAVKAILVRVPFAKYKAILADASHEDEFGRTIPLTRWVEKAIDAYLAERQKKEAL